MLKRNIHICLVVVLALTFSLKSRAQFSSLMDFMYKPTTIQLGWHALDDDAKAYSNVFALNKWSMLYYPTRVSFAKTLVEGLKLDLSISFTKMKQSSYAVERYLPPGIFFNTDLNCRYQFPINFKGLENLYSPQASAFKKLLSGLGMNLFPIAGFGFSKRSQTEFANAATMNFGFGGTFWFDKGKFGISAQSVAKWGIQKPFLHAGSNYIHHSIGLVYVTKGTPTRSSNRFRVVRRGGRRRGASKMRF